MGPGEPIAIGSNRVTVRGDVVSWVCGPEVTAADIRVGQAIFDEVLTRYGHLCIVATISELGQLDSEARREHSGWHKQRRPHCLVGLIGGSIVARALARLVLTASQLVSREKRLRFDYFDDEAQARAWI